MLNNKDAGILTFMHTHPIKTQHLKHWPKMSYKYIMWLTLVM